METLPRDRFREQELLGETALARTARALDTLTGRSVVVKSLRLGKGVDPKALELLEREARVLANLEHPRIPRALGLYQDDDADGRRVCLVTEWVPGRNLAQVIASGKRFTEREVVDMAIAIVEVLAYLHGFSPPIIHRDIKPANLILTATGALYLIDFGGVRDRMMQDESPHGGGMTIVGSYGYMPYEQFEGRAVPASDFYALGVTLVFLLSHKEPGELDKDGMRLRIRGEVNVSEAFVELLERMTSPDWIDRPRTSAELLEELRRLRDRGTPLALARRPRALALVSWTMLGAAALVAGVVTLVERAPGPQPVPAARPRRPGLAPAPAPPSVSIAGLPVVRGRLLFDGRPVTEVTRIAPSFWFRNEDTGRAVGGAARAHSDGRYEVYALAPGRYGMSVRIDANTANGFLLPGDFESWTQFTVEPERASETDVSLRRILHMVSPQDNGEVMKGWNAVCEGKPEVSGVRFAWEEVLPGARYDYVISRVGCPYKHLDGELSGSTFERELVAKLPESKAGEFYILNLTAVKDGRMVGQLMTRGSNGHGWDYRFRVVD